MTTKIVLSLLLLSFIPCRAQEGGKVTVRSVIFPGAGILDPLELYTGDKKEPVSVPIWGGKFSPEFELPRLDVWRFGHWETTTDDQGKTVRLFKERGRTKPPSANRAWLIFFQQASPDDSPLDVKALGVDDTAIKEGGFAIMNLTKGPIGMEIPGEKVKLDPGGRKLVQPGSQRGQVYPVKFYYSHNGKARPFVATTWFHGERRKRLAMVVQEKADRAPRLLTVDDIAAKPVEPE